MLKSRKFLSPFDGGKAFIFMIAIYLLLSFSIPYLLNLFLEKGSLAYNLITSTFSIISMLVVFLLYKRNFGYKALELSSINKFPIFYLGLSLLLSAGMFLGLGFVNTAFANGLRLIGLKTSSVNIKITTISDVILYSIFVAVLPAIMEEVFFRGLLVNSLKYCKKIFIVLSVGCVFAFYHANAVQLIYQFIYGVLLTALTIKAKSVIPAIISHFLNNFVVILFTYLKIDVDFFKGYIIAIGLVLLGLFVLGIAFSDKITRQKRIEQATIQPIKWFWMPNGIFALISLSLLVLGGML